MVFMILILYFGFLPSLYSIFKGVKITKKFSLVFMAVYVSPELPRVLSLNNTYMTTSVARVSDHVSHILNTVSNSKVAKSVVCPTSVDMVNHSIRIRSRHDCKTNSMSWVLLTI